MTEKSARRERDRREWIVELVIFTLIIPFVVYSMLSLGSLPVAQADVCTSLDPGTETSVRS